MKILHESSHKKQITYKGVGVYWLGICCLQWWCWAVPVDIAIEPQKLVPNLFFPINVVISGLFSPRLMSHYFS